jgi:peroxiredoxin
MVWIKRIVIVMVVVSFVFSACGEKSEENTLSDFSSVTFESEDQVVEQYQQLKKAEKFEDGLALLNRGLEQFPVSGKIGAEKYRLLRKLKRYEACYLWIKDMVARVPEPDKKDWIGGVIDILLKWIPQELEKGNVEKAFLYFEEMADAGYRGFHQLRRNEKYKLLREHPEFDRVMKKIEKNTGIGQPAKDFTVTLTSGELFTLSEQKGKVVMVDFWSTTCPPCVEEMPNLRELYLSKREEGLDIISIGLDDDKEKLDAFLAENPIPWKTVFSGKGWGDDIAKLYGVTWIPSIWLVDKMGILRYFDHRGEDLKSAIEALLAE